MHFVAAVSRAGRAIESRDTRPSDKKARPHPARGGLMFQHRRRRFYLHDFEPVLRLPAAGREKSRRTSHGRPVAGGLEERSRPLPPMTPGALPLTTRAI